MNETRIPGQELQDEFLKTVRKSQEAVVDAIRPGPTPSSRSRRSCLP